MHIVSLYSVSRQVKLSGSVHLLFVKKQTLLLNAGGIVLVLFDAWNHIFDALIEKVKIKKFVFP